MSPPSFLVKGLAYLSATSRFFRYLVSCDHMLYSRLMARVLTGAHIVLSGAVNPFITPVFGTVLPVSSSYDCKYLHLYLLLCPQNRM